jgi:Heparinase II/III-like protein/Heparinase II/III N-terminus
MSRLARVLSLVGPRPLVLARTVFFLGARRRRRRRLSRLYNSSLAPAAVELRLPTIGLAAVDELPPELHDSAERLRAEADHVLAHRVDILGSGLVELGPEIDWHRDFKSGYRWPRRYCQDVEVTRLHDQSDAKVPWELSRCHHLLTLARAARLFEDDRYAAELERQLASWLDSNPPGVGINWTTPMEAGIRAVNLVWAIATLEEWRGLDPELRVRLVASLRWHGRHIAANLEGTPYLRSNHYLGDILGLLVLGTVLIGEPAASKWARFAHREFEREIVKQVYVDGVSFEASLAYHGLVLEMLLIASYLAAWAGSPLSDAFHARLRGMIVASHSARHPNGRIPLFGDQDSGRILPEGFARPPTHDNLLWLGAALVGPTRQLEGAVHSEVAWTLGLEAWREAAELGPAPPAMPTAFAQGGIYCLRAKRIHVVVRCGDVGQNGSGGHSHNDLLSYELSIDGVPLVVDSGTYAYTFDVDARNAFRSTRAHNTVVVDDAEINPIDPTRVFELRGYARPRIKGCDLEGDRLELVGSHDGYRRLDDPVVHRRRFSLTPAELTVEDEFLGTGSHRLQSFVHFDRGASLHRLSNVSYGVQSGDVRATISFTGVVASELEAGEGLVSDRYGVREPAPVLIASVRRRCPARLAYEIAPGWTPTTSRG